MNSTRPSIGTLARSGAATGAIKLASAGLTFLLFLAAAMATDERQFGLFSTGYAAASLISFFSIVGQHAVVMRFWPQYAGNGDVATANSLMRRAILVTIAGLAASSLVMLPAAFLPFGEPLPEWRALCLAAIALAVVLGWSEFAACSCRAKGALFTSLLPRDIIWRILAIAAFALTGFFMQAISAMVATWLMAMLLFACIMPQTIRLLRETYQGPRATLSDLQKAEFRSVTLGLWGVTALPPALAQAGTLLVAAILGPEAAGAIFVADRVMRLAVLALNGINQALAPLISNIFYGGDRPHAQRLTGLVAVAGFAIALVMLAVFVLLGKPILAMFDPAYANDTMHAVLIVLGIGALAGTACGPTELIMQLTGLQGELFKTLVAVNTLGLAATAGLTFLLGPLGAALAMAATMTVWCVTGATITRRRIGIDPTILGFLAGQDAAALRTILKGRP